MQNNQIVKIVKKVAALAGIISAIIGLSFLMSWPVYMLWNGCLVGAITGVQEVTWMQSWGLVILSVFLFKTMPTSNS